MASAKPEETLLPDDDLEQGRRVQHQQAEAAAANPANPANPAHDNYPNVPPPEYFEHPPPPSYHVAAELPSYEEAERTKGKFISGDEATLTDNLGLHHHHHHLNLLSFPGGAGSGILSSADSSSLQDDLLDASPDVALLGNDFVFFTAFITAFLFNWVGFLLLMCFCHTIAARYGALAGFGLSLTKWTLIVKRSTELASNDNSWLWWLIMAFGLLICVRAIVQYLHIKRSWGALTTSARERLFFFY